MTSRERVIRTLRHEPVDRAPRELWTLPGIHMYRRQEFERMTQRFPGDFAAPVYSYGAATRAKGAAAQVGHYTDAWGSVWYVGEPGVIGEVKEPAIPDWSYLDAYKPPFELLEGADFSQISASCAATDSFVKVGTETRPFERLQFLRGTEETFIDLAYGSAEVFRLLEMLHDFYCREMRMWAKTDVDAVAFMDDWGSQNALLISPAMWRQVFKPMYKDYCDILHEGGKWVFFHSDGNIQDVYPDLIEVGVDAVNSQLFCMDIEKLGELYSGKITFWGEIDRQNVLPFGTTDDVRNAVTRVRRALDRGNGGVIAQCEWGMDTPEENVAAVFDAWIEG